jgi:hypothetical protein
MKFSKIRSGVFIPLPDLGSGFFPSPIRILDPGVKKAPDPGSRSATLLTIDLEKEITYSEVPTIV